MNVKLDNHRHLQLIVLALLGCTLIQIQIRQIKYLNNIVEQDHRGIKRIVKPMMGSKSFHSAEATLAGIELCRMLKKGQHINSEKVHILSIQIDCFPRFCN